MYIRPDASRGGVAIIAGVKWRQTDEAPMEQTKAPSLDARQINLQLQSEAEDGEKMPAIGVARDYLCLPMRNSARHVIDQGHRIWLGFSWHVG